MVVDYSKWDRLELSDDSDIEVHPNVDKKSFIRWKQRGIHEKREQNKHKIRQDEFSIEMNGDLLKAVKALRDHGVDLQDSPKNVKIAMDALGGKKRPLQAVSQDQNANQNVYEYSDMLIDLLRQLKSTLGDSATPQQYEEKLDDTILRLQEEVDKARKDMEQRIEERAKHIVSDDLHTGFDTTIIRKSPSTQSGQTQPSTTASTETIEVLNPQSAQKSQSEKSPPTFDDPQASPAAIEFSTLEPYQFDKCLEFLSRTPCIVNEQQKDSLLMLAFQQQLDGRTEEMERTVFNALVLQYCYLLGGDGIRLFFTRIKETNSKAKRMFEDEVASTIKHIKTRCEVIKAETENEEEEQDTENGAVEQVQLRAVDEGTQIIMKKPDPCSSGYEIYQKLPDDLKRAIDTGSLEQVNQVLGKASVGEGEQLIKDLDESGVLSIEQKIYEPEEWQKKQQELRTSHAESSEQVLASGAEIPADMNQLNDELD